VEQPLEVANGEYELVYERVAPVDVAKACGVVCTPVSDESPPGAAALPRVDSERWSPSWVITCAASRSRSSPWNRPTTDGSGTWSWRAGPGCSFLCRLSRLGSVVLI